MWHVGVDPGLSGGVAAIREDGTLVCWKMPKTELDMLNLFTGIQEESDGVRGVVERLAGVPRRGGKTVSSASSMLKMGTNYGMLRMAMTASGWRWRDIPSSTWQRHFTLWGLNLPTPSAKKNEHKRKAQNLYPGTIVTLWSCDAILIASYWVEKG